MEYDYESNCKSKLDLIWEINLEKDMLVYKEALQVFDMVENYDFAYFVWDDWWRGIREWVH
mgnify:FL=1